MTQSQFDRDKLLNRLGVLTRQEMGCEVHFTCSALFKPVTQQPKKRKNQLGALDMLIFSRFFNMLVGYVQPANTSRLLWAERRALCAR